MIDIVQVYVDVLRTDIDKLNGVIKARTADAADGLLGQAEGMMELSDEARVALIELIALAENADSNINQTLLMPNRMQIADYQSRLTAQLEKAADLLEKCPASTMAKNLGVV